MSETMAELCNLTGFAATTLPSVSFDDRQLLVVSFGLNTYDAEHRREIDWLIDQGWLDHLPNSLRLSVAGRNEFERRQAHGAGPCPTCGRASD